MLHKFLNLKKHIDIIPTFERGAYRSSFGEYEYKITVVVLYKKKRITAFNIKAYRLVNMIRNDHKWLISQIVKESKPDDFWMMIGCLPTKDVKKIEASYRKMCMVYHPDHGGNTEVFNKLTKSKEKALEFANK